MKAVSDQRRQPRSGAAGTGTPASRPPRTRQERRDETRRRIVEATVELHSTIGPARTSYSAIARQASVTRPTVYAYFPDKATLFAACSGHANAIDPVPDPARWSAVRDPIERLRRVLSELYAYYRRNARMVANVERDMAMMAGLSGRTPPPDHTIEADRRKAMETFVADLSPMNSADDARLLVAALRHAFAFSTWRSLTERPGVSDDEAVELAVGLVEHARRRSAATTGARVGREAASARSH